MSSEATKDEISKIQPYLSRSYMPGAKKGTLDEVISKVHYAILHQKSSSADGYIFDYKGAIVNICEVHASSQKLFGQLSD